MFTKRKMAISLSDTDLKSEKDMFVVHGTAAKWNALNGKLHRPQRVLGKKKEEVWKTWPRQVCNVCLPFLLVNTWFLVILECYNRGFSCHLEHHFFFFFCLKVIKKQQQQGFFSFTNTVVQTVMNNQYRHHYGKSWKDRATTSEQYCK